MKTNTKISIVSHIAVFMMGVALATALFYREDPLAAEAHDPMFTYDEAGEGCGCGDSVDNDALMGADTAWIRYKPAKR